MTITTISITTLPSGPYNPQQKLESKESRRTLVFIATDFALVIGIPPPAKFSIGVKSSLRNSDAKDLVFMSICMGEEKALLGVKDIGILAGTVEEDANPEALGIGAEEGVDCI